MAFWNETALDPKRQFKFRLSFTGPILGGPDTKFLAQSADRPVWTISGETKVDFLDKSFNFPGKVKWNDVKVKFVDSAGANVNVSKQSYEYLAKTGWLKPGNGAVAGEAFNPAVQTAANYKTIGKASAANAAGTVVIEVLNSGGNPEDKWTLNNAFITTVALNNLDYAAEGILTAEYTFKYDWADYGV